MVHPHASRFSRYQQTLPMHRVALDLVIWERWDGGTARTSLFPRLRLVLVGMRTCRRSPSSSAPALSRWTCGSGTLLCPTAMGMAGKRQGLRSGAQVAPVCAWCIDSFVLSLFSYSDLASTYTSGNRTGQAVTKPFRSTACFSYFQSYCFRSEKTSSSSKCTPSYRPENLQQSGFSPPE